MRHHFARTYSLVVLFALGSTTHGCTKDREETSASVGTSGAGLTVSGAGGDGGTNGQGGGAGGATTNSGTGGAGGAVSSSSTTNGAGGDGATATGTGGEAAGPGSGTGGSSGGQLDNCLCMIDRIQFEGCGDCFADQLEGGCADAYQSCLDSAGCVNVSNCLQLEECGDLACLNSCRDSESAAALEIFDALYTCACTSCDRFCAPDDSCE